MSKSKKPKMYAEDDVRTILPIALTLDHHRIDSEHGACRSLLKSRKTQAINVRDDKHAEKIMLHRLSLLEKYAEKIGLWLDHNVDATGMEHNDL